MLTDNQVVNVDSVEMILTVSRMETDTVILASVTPRSVQRLTDWDCPYVRESVRVQSLTPQ